MVKSRESKEPEKESLLDGVKKKVKGFFSEVGSAFGEGMKGGAEVIIELIHKKIDEMKKEIKHKITYSLLLVLGGIFLLCGIAFLINDMFQLPDYTGFLVIGAIILVIGLVYRSARM